MFPSFTTDITTVNEPNVIILSVSIAREGDGGRLCALQLVGDYLDLGLHS